MMRSSALLRRVACPVGKPRPRSKAITFGKLWMATAHRDAVVVDNENNSEHRRQWRDSSGRGDHDLSFGLYRHAGMIDSHTHMTFYWDPASDTIRCASRRDTLW
jgi:hypothetical protein